MVIHHDKMAYGKLKSLKDDIPEDKLAAMAKLLSQSGGEQDDKEKDGKKPEDKKS